MPQKEKRPVGLTKDAGFQIGARRTFPVSLTQAWELVTSDAGVRAWLGDTQGVELAQGAEYRLADHSTGEVRVFKPLSHLRFTWQPGNWPKPSTIQVRVIPNKEKTVIKTVIAFHQENLPNAEARKARRTHFIKALDALQRLVPDFSLNP